MPDEVTRAYSGRPRRDDATLAEKVRLLSDPAHYAHRPQTMERVETHMSWVFLAGGLVFKLKKPVRDRVLDFSTLAGREADCLAEVRLNRRLARDIYLGVTPLTRERGGSLAIDGKGAIVDWLVTMKRLPRERMLDEAIGAGTVTRRSVEEVAAILTAFYRRAERPKLDPDFLWRVLAREHAESRRILTDASLGLPAQEVEPVLAAMDAALSHGRADLRDRVLAGAVVDAHGDLRAEHVCLTDPPVIIDCLEFNKELRSLDPFDEVGFLALECERLGAAWIGARLMERCRTELAPPPPGPLLALYRASRALLRARLAIAHLLEPDPRAPEKWRPLAETYLAVVKAALNAPRRPEARRSSRHRGGI